MGSLEYWLYLCKKGDIREDEFRKDKVTNPCQITLRESMVSPNNDKVGSKNKTKSEVMKYIFRGIVVFEYDPNVKYDKVKHGKTETGIPAYDFCSMIDEDYKLLGNFFDTVYRHTQGENVTLEDIEVY